LNTFQNVHRKCTPAALQISKYAYRLGLILHECNSSVIGVCSDHGDADVKVLGHCSLLLYSRLDKIIIFSLRV